MVEVEREEGEMVEFDETLKAMDKVVESEFHEDSTSGQDTSRWIMPYDPSSREVLLWKGAIVARLSLRVSDQHRAVVSWIIQYDVNGHSKITKTHKCLPVGF